MLTQRQADILIDYLETMEELTRHQTNVVLMVEKGVTEKDLDEACQELGRIAERDYSIL